MFGETTTFHVKIWNHPIETPIYKQMFQVPGSTVVTDWEKTLKAFRRSSVNPISKWCHCCVVFFSFFTGREPWQFQSKSHPLQELPFLKLTSEWKHLKMDDWQMRPFPFGAFFGLFFRCELLLVSGSVWKYDMLGGYGWWIILSQDALEWIRLRFSNNH